ncbi:hypothetical protein WR25_20108 [Diploscapter pachys]|uniref:CX domain-containing protein n=1 Tax=Diploscapter pachys TaxID=2018661 RepID=A0A2A2KVT8_9BILA|nr:hypothetical protein WR25_20108 [Diploscapter pachys]
MIRFLLFITLYSIFNVVAHSMIYWPQLPPNTANSPAERLYSSWKEKPMGQMCRNFTLNIRNQCPNASPFHEYVCCGSTGAQCCFAIQQWVIIMAAMFGVSTTVALIFFFLLKFRIIFADPAYHTKPVNL